MEKQRAAARGIAEELAGKIRGGTLLGLGSGSTVAMVLEEISLRLGKDAGLRGVPTSAQIEAVAVRSGIELVRFNGRVDLVIDGADQLDEGLRLIKGGGGALLKEKVLMTSASEVAIVASAEKFARRLCDNGVRVPVEVVPMAVEGVRAKLRGAGGRPEERLLPKGYPYFTENGNVILDVGFDPLDRPEEVEREVKLITGVAEVGIFSVKPLTAYRMNEDGSFDVLP
jgi:ribose 5-phosphate isomerase A